MTVAYIQKNAFNDNQWVDYKLSFCDKPLTISEIEFQDTYGTKTPIYVV
jgi:hypothetical protein